MSVCAALGFMTAAPMNLLFQKQGDYEAVVPMDFKPNPVNYPKAIPSAGYSQKDDRNALQKLGLEAANDAMDNDGNEEDGVDEDEADEDEADAGEDEDITDVDENEDNQVGNFEAVAPMDFSKGTLGTKKALKALIKKLKAIIKKTPNESDALKAIKELIQASDTPTNIPKIIKKTIKEDIQASDTTSTPKIIKKIKKYTKTKRTKKTDPSKEAKV
jgi:hypothetical protein